MLILTRKVNEKVLIDGGKVTVTVVALANGRVRLGFEAPPEVPVDREEIHRAKTQGPEPK